MASLSLTIAFFLVAILEYGFIDSLQAPVKFIPLLFIGAILIYQRVDVVLGFTWMTLATISQFIFGFASIHPFAWFLAAILMIPLVQRIFTNRSIYALVTFGFVSYLILLISNTIVQTIHRFVTDQPFAFTIPSSTIIPRLVTLVVAITISYILAKSVSKTARRFFYLRTNV